MSIRYIEGTYMQRIHCPFQQCVSCLGSRWLVLHSRQDGPLNDGRQLHIFVVELQLPPLEHSGHSAGGEYVWECHSLKRSTAKACTATDVITLTTEWSTVSLQTVTCEGVCIK